MGLLLFQCRTGHFPLPDSIKFLSAISLACWGPSEQQQNPLAYQPLLPVCVISRFAESALYPIIQINNEDIEQFWTQNLFATFIATYTLVKGFTGFGTQWILAFLTVSACLGQCLSITSELSVPVFTFCIFPFSPGLWSYIFPVSPRNILTSTISWSLQARQPSPFPQPCSSTFTLFVNKGQQSTLFANCLYQSHQAVILRCLCSSHGCIINTCPTWHQLTRVQVHLLATLTGVILKGGILLGF